VIHISPARQISFRILIDVHGGGYASDLLRRECAGLDSRDAGLAESIVFGCLRYQSQLDFLIQHFSGRAQLKLDDAVRIALRMGIFQICYLDRIPKHAAVSESVELVKRAHKVSAAGFVNAVLRKAIKKSIRWPDRATELSIPAWMLQRWQKHYGADTAARMAEAALEEPGEYIHPETGRQQDIGSQSIVPLLELAPGMKVLDLCAAPGNKTAQMLAAGANVVACDRYLQRLREVPTEAQRVVLDATQPLPFPAGGFDRILVDAPCSGTGTLARNPEIKWRLKPEDLPAFQARQKAILKNALVCLKPQGKLLYSTCSLEAEENENVVDGYRVQAMSHRLPGRDEGDGFFAAVVLP
jgi:16S rRNA (cytosine967-C5)-methyltransferase